MDRDIVIAILIKDKELTLPYFLECLLRQTWPKERTLLYVRTNNNFDRTVEIIEAWLEKHGHLYRDIHYDKTDVPEKLTASREWSTMRFKVLGKIRQESVQFAKDHDCHYFVVDCDNFIVPHTLERLHDSNMGVVAPFLRTATSPYSNFHHAVDENGYMGPRDADYDTILFRKVTGFVIVPVVHCSYFIRHDVLGEIAYEDNSHRYEYVIFSDVLRKAGIHQYLDTREVYGMITFAETHEALMDEFHTFSSSFQLDFSAYSSTGLTEVFSGHYVDTKEWLGGSGWGSTADFNQSFIDWMRWFLERQKGVVRSVVDLGCGDWQFSRHIFPAFPDIQYLGIDCVPSVIERNQKEFTDPHLRFTCSELDVDGIPDADLYIMKDVLQHWSNARVTEFVTRLKAERSFKFIMICNCLQSGDVPAPDIKDGQWRRMASRLEPLKSLGTRVVFHYQTKEVSLIELEAYES